MLRVLIATIVCLFPVAALGAACAPESRPAPAPAPAPPAPAAARDAPPPAWSFLIYAAIDNDAEVDGNFFEFLDALRAAYADNPDVEVLLFADRSDGYSDNASSLGEDFTGARLYRVRTGACERLDGGEQFPEVAGEFEPDSADPENLRIFLAWARARHPARHTALMLYGHADGRAMCPDEDSGNEMGFAQLTDVVPAELSVDLMALELCNMGGIEIAYQWRPGNGGFSTDYLAAIPNAGPPLDWDRVFARLREPAPDAAPGSTLAATLTSAQLGELIIAEGGAGRRARAAAEPARAERLGYEAVACYDLGRAEAAKRAVDAFAVVLSAGDHAQACARLRGPGPEGFALNYAGDQLERDPYIDLHDFATRAVKSTELSDEAREAAHAMAEAVDAFVLASWGGDALPRFHAGQCGVYITYPLGPDVSWGRCRWYSPLAVPGVYGRLAWCRDGATPGDGVVQNWFELLDAWLDTPGPGEGTNGYAY